MTTESHRYRGSMLKSEDQRKRAAAESAIALVKDEMIVGLGSGSTAAYAVSGLGRRVSQGLRIRGVPTSEQTAAQARALGIPVIPLDENAHIDITIDGADEVEEGTLDLIKGHGGALLREKLVANASKRLVIIVDQRKLVTLLAIEDPIPVEVVPFGWQTTVWRLAKLGATACIRRNPDGEMFRSDGGNYIADCAFDSSISAPELARELDHVVGVVEHGLFIGLTSEVHIARTDGILIVR